MQKIFYWDTWERRAVADGVPPALAQLGREVMRDHYQHGKEDHLLGAAEDGERMLKMCQDDPAGAEEFFNGCVGVGDGCK